MHIKVKLTKCNIYRRKINMNIGTIIYLNMVEHKIALKINLNKIKKYWMTKYKNVYSKYE